MATLKIDADGVPYWDQPDATHWDYTVDWTSRMAAVNDTVVSAVWSATGTGLAPTSTTFSASGVHTMWVSPSAGNANASYYFSSKIFTNFGRVERARIKVNVTTWD